MKTIKLLAIIEATSITGPAKNLLRFAEDARSTKWGATVEVSALTFERGDGRNVFNEAAKEAGMPVHSIKESKAFDRAVVRRLSSVVKEVQPDLIQTHAVKSHLLAQLAGLGRFAPTIAFHHGYTWPDLKARLYNQLDRWSLRRADRVLTVSLPFRDQVIQMGVQPEKIEVIHNAIDPNWGQKFATATERNALRAKLQIPDTKQVLLIVGRLSKEKDHLTLLQSVTELQRRGDQKLHLLIIGEGPERPVIQAKIQELDLSTAVTLVGQVRSAEPYYAIADVCILSSLSEGSPNALLEGMAMKVPVVATRVGGIPEIVSDRESAVLIEPRNAQAMAQAISEVLSNPELRQKLIENAYQLILQRYTPDYRTQRLVDVYSGLVGAAQPLAT